MVGQIGQENVFNGILEKKLSRLLNRNLKKWKNSDSSKGISPWFCQKFQIFPCFSYAKKMGKNLLDIILKRKRRF